MDALTQESTGHPATGHRDLVRDLRKANERGARTAALLEARRERHLRIERVVQVQRENRLRQGG
jgi:hypothetical protein